MSGLDAEKLKRLQDKWSSIAVDQTDSYVYHVDALEDIAEGLKDMGLDPAQDATYDLLAPGLTQKTFEETKAQVLMLQVLDIFHRAQKLSGDENDYAGQQVYRQHHRLGRLLTYALPAFEAAGGEASLPADVNLLQRRELAFIRQLQQDGTLEDELKNSAYRCAIQSFRTVHSYYKQMIKKPEDDGYRTFKEGLGYATKSLEYIDKAQEFYQPQDVHLEYGSRGGWKGEKTRFDRAAVEAYRDEFMLKISGIEFKQAKVFQDQGHFVLDSSGSGHGAMTLPMQRILERLQENGHNPADPQVYARMGTDMETFWAAYQLERREVGKDSQYAKMLKPEFKK
ncbi:MAG: hypothetical protein ACXW30_03345 [Micavibrio sp.]